MQAQAGSGGAEKKGKDYAFRRQFNEKPSIIPGCPGVVEQVYLPETGLHAGSYSGLH